VGRRHRSLVSFGHGHVKRFLPALCGLMAGVVLAAYFLGQPEEGIPSLFWYRVVDSSVFIHGLLLPKSDPLNASVFFAPICILFCALPGALLGFLTGMLLKSMRRHEL